MEAQFEGRGDGRPAVIAAEFTQFGDRILGAAPWGDAKERFMVFTVRGDRIVDMQGFTSRRDAERFARR